MPDLDPRAEQVDQVGQHLIVELCQFLYLLRILVVVAFVFRPNEWGQDLLVLLALVTMPALVATFWLPRLVDSVRSHPMFAAVDLAFVMIALYVTSNQGIVFLISLFAAATLGLLYRGTSLILLTALLAAAYVVAAIKEEPIPSVWEGATALGAYAAVVLAAVMLQRRTAQLTDYGIVATRSVAQLRERERLAREMHDGVVKTLYGIALSATGLARSAKIPEEVRGQLDSFAQAAEFGVQQARESLVELRIDQDDRPFRVVVEDVVSRWSERTRVPQTVNVRGLVDIDVGPRTELLACLREALDNVAEHARADSVVVDLVRSDEEITLTVSDDGRGIESGRLHTARRQGHFGLHGMSERMELVGGSVTVEASPEGGVSVCCRAPAGLGSNGLSEKGTHVVE